MTSTPDSPVETGWWDRWEDRVRGTLSRAGLAPFTIVFCLMVWVLRRPGQLLHPYIWCEESFVLRSWLDHGWSAAFEPLQGYFAFPSTFLITIAAEISPAGMPVIEYAFATIVFLVTVAALVIPDSRWGDLRIRSLFAILLVLVPSDPEVFGVLLYSFWWAGLWPLVVLGWTRPLWALRIPLLAVAALSSPAGCAMVLIFALAWLRERGRVLLVSAAVLGVGAVVQVVAVATSDRGSSLAGGLTLGNLTEGTIRSGGFYVSRWTASGMYADRAWSLFVGLLFAGFVAWATYTHVRARREWSAAYLALAAVILAAISQVPAPMASEPLLAAGRYYFHPYTLFAWLLVYLWSQSRVEPLRRTAIVLVALSLITLGTGFSRPELQRSQTLDWRAELESCAASPAENVDLRIMYDGSPTVWALQVTPEECRRMLG
ncbi:hypothetical protein KVF89_08985 [Nocardioides carbamazepini]|uniref:hypothetical protein n=1 Tax=Nocardioides carbamazepini TaxID=2854259 RepID=UPI002149C4CD|nr:hypothetical protein [Nocardioides carbamazepini]MCR1782664.1 hypothetical protein [Nocardioides carbamazepini]